LTNKGQTSRRDRLGEKQNWSRSGQAEGSQCWEERRRPEKDRGLPLDGQHTGWDRHGKEQGRTEAA
jgi:hypothetical protein